jgi:hypothetical protein
VHKVRLVHKDHRDKLVRQARKVQLVPRDRKDRQAQRVRKDRKGHKVPLGKMEPTARTDKASLSATRSTTPSATTPMT